MAIPCWSIDGDAMPERLTPNRELAIPDQLLQIAHEQEGGAERVIGQIEVVEHSFEEIQALIRECQNILTNLMPASPERDDLISKMEDIALHADNGAYNVQGVFDLFQYQDIIRQKLEKVGHRLIDISEYLMGALHPQPETAAHAVPSGRDILESKVEVNEATTMATDDIVAEFFAKLRQTKSNPAN